MIATLLRGGATERALAISRAVEQVVRRSRDAIAILFEAEGGFAVDYANPAFEELVGRPIDTWTSRALLAEDELPSAVTSLLFEADGADPVRRELRLRDREGDDLVIEAEVRCLEAGSGWPRFVVLRDVTDYKRLEHIAAALEVSESVGYVFAGIRHELGNPLNSIKAVLSLLDDPAVSLSPERTAEYIKRAAAEVRRMEHLLHQLRTFNEHEVVHLSSIGIRPFLERFARLASSDCAARGATLELEIGGDATVSADDRILHQVLLLLLANALDAVEDQPKKEIRIVAQVHARTVKVLLSDSGTGMTHAQLANVKRPFVTTKSKGTGLGLPLAHRYAALLQCRLEIASVPGEGTTCTLHFEQITSSAP